MRISDWSSDVCSSDLGRVDTRIYIVDGTSVFDEESSHRGHDPEQTGLDTVAQAMERRRANTLAAERDPAAAEIVHELAGWGLRRLSDELARLDATLAEGPDDVTEALRTTVRRQDAVLTRRQRSEEHTSEIQSLMRIS